MTDWMEKVLDEASKAMEKGEVPIAAIITEDGKEVARSHTEVTNRNCTAAHAEMLAIMDVGPTWNRNLTLYTNLEPCIMCMAAAVRFGIQRIVYGMNAQNEISIDLETIDVESNEGHIPEIEGPVAEDKSKKLFQKFLDEKSDHFARGYVEGLLGVK